MNKTIRIILCLLIVSIFTTSSNAQTATQTFEKNGNKYVVTKTITNGVATIETKIYDPSGNLLDTKTVVKNANPTPVKTLPEEYPTKTIAPTLKPANPAVEVSTQPDLGVSEPTDVAPVVPPVVTRESVAVKAQEEGINRVVDVTLMENSSGSRHYVVSGVRQERFLLLFPVELQISYVFDEVTGNRIKSEQSLTTKILDFFSH